MSRPRFTLTIQADHRAADPAGIRRLRMVLKRLLRSHALRCIDVRAADEARTPNPDGEYSYPLTSLADAYAEELAKIETADAFCVLP